MQHASAGLTADTAAALFDRAERQLGAAAPPPHLSQTHMQPYLQAAAAAGLHASPHPPPLPHPAAANATIWPAVVTADASGRRRDAAAAYLSPALSGPCAHNLRVVQPAVVRRVVFTSGRAVAVEYLRMDAAGGPQPRRVAAAAEVIVSAGPYGSPQVLQLSGVGPGGVLRMHGIEVVRDAPVGLNSIVRAHPPRIRSGIGLLAVTQVTWLKACHVSALPLTSLCRPVSSDGHTTLRS